MCDVMEAPAAADEERSGGAGRSRCKRSLTKRARVNRSIKTPRNGVTAAAACQDPGVSRRAPNLTVAWVICPWATEDAGHHNGPNEQASALSSLPAAAVGKDLGLHCTCQSRTGEVGQADCSQRTCMRKLSRVDIWSRPLFGSAAMPSLSLFDNIDIGILL
jgi:hypothetical protein